MDKPLFPSHQFDELTSWDLEYIARNKNWEDYEWWVKRWGTVHHRDMNCNMRKGFNPHQIVIMYLVYFLLNEAE